MLTIKIRETKKIKGIFKFTWKERKPEKGKSIDSLVKDLRQQKKCFKITSSDTEKHYEFNGNNYIITESPKK